MRYHKTILTGAAAAIGLAILVAGCSRKEEQPAAPESPVREKTQTAPAVPATPPTPPKQSAPAVPKATAPTAIAPTGTPAAQASALENAYVSNPDFSSRVATIYKLTDLGSAEAIASLGRLFYMERDNDLKVEIMDSLFDIDGQDERKAALLAAGAGPEQAKEVRETAIDGLEDIDPKLAIPILRALTGDPDPEIREIAKDILESVQLQLTEPK